MTIMGNKTLLVRMLNICYQWFSTSMAYYGLVFASTSLSGDPYVNFTVSALMEIPGYVFTALVLDCWGRRPILVFLQTFPGLCCIAAGLMQGVPDLRVPQILLTLVGKFGSAGCFAMVYVYTAELFPTGARNSVVGVCSMAARIGSILSLLVELLKSTWAPLPMIALGSSSVVAGALAVAFPETAGLPMPDTVEQAVRVGENRANEETMCSCHPNRRPNFRSLLRGS